MAFRDNNSPSSAFNHHKLYGILGDISKKFTSHILKYTKKCIGMYHFWIIK